MRLEAPSSDRAAKASLRPAAPGDLAAVQSIYGFYVARSTATFEETLPDLDEMAQRFEAIAGRGLPFLVAEAAGTIAGFAYAAPFRQRSAYRYTVEDSIYVRDGMDGRGIGRALLGAVIDACEALDYRQMIAVIGDSANARSIRLHGGLGFRPAGTLLAAGFKFGRWIDSVYMQRPLGDGDRSLPRG